MIIVLRATEVYISIIVTIHFTQVMVGVILIMVGDLVGHHTITILMDIFTTLIGTILHIMAIGVVAMDIMVDIIITIMAIETPAMQMVEHVEVLLMLPIPLAILRTQIWQPEGQHQLLMHHIATIELL